MVFKLYSYKCVCFKKSLHVLCFELQEFRIASLNKTGPKVPSICLSQKMKSKKESGFIQLKNRILFQAKLTRYCTLSALNT